MRGSPTAPDRNEEDCLRDTLLSGTVTRAVEDCRYYSELYSSVDWTRVHLLEDLAALPIVSRTDLQQAGMTAVSKAVCCSYIQNTSSSTGAPFFVHRSREEAEFIDQFYGALLTDVPAPDPLPIVLSLQGTFHGTNTSIPSRAFVLHGTPHKNSLAALNRRFEIPGVASSVSVLSGPLRFIAALTNLMLLEGNESRYLGLDAIYTSGDYLSSRLAALISASWECPIIDRLTMAEAFGGATSCDRCGGYHYDPTVVPEIVRPSSLEPTNNGVGLVAITTLYPFVQMQPLLRYLTGDVGEIFESPCSRRSYRFLGRVEHLLVNDSKDVLLTGADILEALDAFPTIARCKNNELGLPFAYGTMSHRPGGSLALELILELTFEPALFPAAVDALDANVVAALRNRSPALARALESSEVTLRVVALRPGSIGMSPFDPVRPFWSP